MAVTISTIIVVLILVTSVVWAAFFGGQIPRPFHGCNCQGKGWRQTFPSVPKQELRVFLSVFVEAFAFLSKEKLKFSPDDQILQVYRALYPSKWLRDALELETLKDIKAKDSFKNNMNISSTSPKFGFTLKSIWH